MVEPYFINFAPAAFVATLPPIELDEVEENSIGKNLPFSSTNFFALSVITPGWQITSLFSSFHWILLSFSVLRTISPSVAVAPPFKPVLPPEITIFNLFLEAKSIMSVTSSSFSGKKIAIGDGVNP